MTERLKSGMTREDGYIFSQYMTARNGRQYQVWLSPEAYERDKARRRRKIADKRKNPGFLKTERAKKNAQRREKYRQDAEYRERQKLASKGRAHKLTQISAEKRRNRSRERYRNDPEFRALIGSKVASRRQRTRLKPLSKSSRMIVREIYKQRDRLTKCTGIPHHVDHIIPIARGGTHCPSNLQAITQKRNARKHAKLN